MADDNMLQIEASRDDWGVLLSVLLVIRIAKRQAGRLIDQNCGDSLDVEALNASAKLDTLEAQIVPVIKRIAGALNSEAING